MLLKQLFQTDDVGNKRAGALYLPDDLATNIAKCALLVFNHGSGESGDGTLSTLGNETSGTGVFTNGSPVFIANQRGNMTFTSPLDGKSYRYIVIALQGIRGWCCQATEVDYVVSALLKQYNIDPNLVFQTGLSAGGETTWESIAGPNYSLYSGAVPMSTPAINTGIIDWNRLANNKTRIWAFHGNKDTGITDYYNSVRYVAAVNAVNSGTAYLTSYTNAHCCWATYYSPSYKETFTVNGKAGSYNIYEILLASVRNTNFLFSGSVVVNPPTPVANLTANLIVNPSGSTASFSGVNSTGSIGSWWINVISKPVGAGNPWWDNGRSDGGAGDPSTIVKSATGLADGIWTFTLNLQGKDGSVAISAPVSVTISAVAIPTKTITFQHVMNDGKTLTVYSDYSYTII